MSNLTLLPGLACDATLWRDLLPDLASHHRVRVSDVHMRQPTLPMMARALLAENPGPLWLAGASMGGMLALEVWRQAPERVRGMALLGSSARPDTPEQLALRAQAIELFAAGRIDEVLQANLLFAFHPLSARDPVLTQAYLAMVQRAGAAQLITQNRAVMARPDSRAELPRVRCPVFIACGEADQLTPPQHSREMSALLPQARLEIVPGAGHMLTMEQPARVGTLLLDWLRTLPAADTPGQRPSAADTGPLPGP